MDKLIDLIKESGSVRRFQKKKISKKNIAFLIKAAIWGPSLFGIQPWRFVFVTDKKDIQKITAANLIASERANGGLRKLLELASRIMSNAQVLIAVYINNRIKNEAVKYGGKICGKKGWMAEILASGAATQNIFLILNSLGLGGVWLDAPTIFPDGINKILGEKDELVVILAIGHPDQNVRRSKRDYNALTKLF